MEWVLLAVPVLLALGAAGWAVALLVATVRGRDRAHQVVPGVDSPAPRGWVGAHSPEARLHRRLRDVVAALRALPGVDTAGASERAAVERQVLALDERLVAVAALPEGVRAGPLAEVTAVVDRLEQAVGRLASGAVGGDASPDRAVDELAAGFARLREASAEVEALLAQAQPPRAEPELRSREPERREVPPGEERA